jgi:hypothetical protein
MSVPAFAARYAMWAVVRPRDAAVPSSPSVIVTPRKPRVERRSVVLIAGDQPAAAYGS